MCRIFLEELRALERPFDAVALEELREFCSRPFDPCDVLHLRRKVYLKALEVKLEGKERIGRNHRRTTARRFEVMESTK